MKSIFSKEEVNTGRQIEVDIAKAICIIGMVIVHCFEMYCWEDAVVDTTIQFVFIYILNTIFGASTFMFCMGVGLAYTKKDNPHQTIKRGILIFVLGYLLSLLCGLGYIVLLHNMEYFILTILIPDILQFAGLALILFGLLKKLKLPDWGIGVVAIVMSIIGTILRGIETSNVLSIFFLGMFAGIHDSEFFCAPFPLLNWFIFVIAGYCFAKLLRRSNNRGRLYCYFSVVSAIVVIAYILIMLPTKSGLLGNIFCFNTIATWDALICIAGALSVLGLYHLVSKIISEKVAIILTNVSRNITIIYFIQWVLIVWIRGFLMSKGISQLSDGVLLLGGLILFVISALLAKLIVTVRLRTGNGA